jgi:transcriptional regulator with XRE-family HTH domain
VDHDEIWRTLPDGSAYRDLPNRIVTINQIVAYNMTRFRRAAGLTQEQLGELLGGWSAASVSAAERSWDGKRIRKFDADEIVAIAGSLGVPLPALFLPPEDDGIEVTYWASVPATARLSGLNMSELLACLTSEPSLGEHESPARAKYRERYMAALNSYFGPDSARELAAHWESLTTAERIAEQINRLRSQHAALREVLGDNDRLQEALGERQLVQIGKEIFGKRGPANRQELERVFEEARKRGIEGVDSVGVVFHHDGTYELVLAPDDTDDRQAQP